MAATLSLPAPEAWAERRVLVVVAHPDDEVIGCGALLATLRDVRIVQVTNGAPRGGDHAARAGFSSSTEYAAARRAETVTALELAGVPAERLIGFGIDDQAAPQHLVPITQRLVPLVADVDLVLTHAYEGGHGDHDAVAFATHAAMQLGQPGRRPSLVEMPFYFASAEGWVRQRFLPPDREALPEPAENAEIAWVLSPEARARKAQMVAAHASQAETLASFPIEVERFRPAPRYDFTRRPHDGDLLYERHGWSQTWPAWQAAVRTARTELGLA